MARPLIRFLFSARAVGGILMAMMILTCGDIFSRTFLRRSIVGTLEIESNYFMVAVVFLPLAYGMISKHGHIRVEILLSRLPLRLQMGMEMLGLFLSLCVFGLVVWFGVAGAWRSWQAGETMVNIALPMGQSSRCPRWSLALSPDDRKNRPSRERFFQRLIARVQPDELRTIWNTWLPNRVHALN
jgi:TRAP-type C4-dicarboxylate transport system permease small subunit